MRKQQQFQFISQGDIDAAINIFQELGHSLLRDWKP